MKKIIITVISIGFLTFISCSFAGFTDLKNEKALAQRKAEVTKVVDPVAGVTYEAIRLDLEAVGTALEAVVAAIDAIDMSTIDPAVFTGTQKTCIQNLKGNLAALKAATKDLKIAAKNNMQATNKLVKKFKQSEIIDQTTK